MALPISAFIIAHNEADRIAAAINSLRGLADEIIVIDSGSTDATVEVATKAGAKTVFNAWRGYGPQKCFGESLCQHRWLLNIDADEEITPELAAEIKKHLETDPICPAFTLRIRDLLPGETELAPMAHTNYAVRLYDRTKCGFSDSPVHDTVQVREGTTLMLENPALHRSFRSLAHAIEKMNSYTSAQAQNLLKKGLLAPHFRLLTEFPFAFFKDYFLRGYCLRGWRGFVYATLYATSRFMRIAKYLELKNKL